MIDNIADGIAYIHSLPKVHTNSDLSFIKQILQEFDNPQDDYDVIHITGTNGKGSVSHFVDQMLINSDYKVGMFTSPYIVEFNERFQINDTFISDIELLMLINEIKTKIDELDDFFLVEFEFVTVLGLLYFSRQNVDVAVIEVGIGGEHDKTNVVTPIISVINNVGLDHQQLIGPTLVDMATEKSGIIKPNSVVVLGDVAAELVPIFENRSKQLLLKFNQDFNVENIVKDETGFNFTFSDRDNQLADINVASIADYQIKNAAVAIETFIQYQNYRHTGIEPATIRKSIQQVQMLARMQIVNQQPLVILDGAHNEHAARALVASMNDFYPNKKIKFLVAMMKDKDFSKVIDIFETESTDLTLTTFAENRSLKEADIVDARFDANWQRFIADFIERDSQEILVVTGSLHFVSLVLNYFNQK